MEAGGGRCKPFLRWVLFMVGSFCQVSEGMDEARTQLQEVKGLFIHKKLNKRTKTTRRGKTNWLAGQGRTGQGRTRLDKAGQDTDDI